MVLGKLPVPGRPTLLMPDGQRANCACSGCGGGGGRVVWTFLLSSLLSLVFSLSLGDGPI